MAHKRSFLARLVRAILALRAAFIAASILSVLSLRWIDPPFTAFMAESQASAWASRDSNYVFRHRWVDLDRISPNLPLAVVASEDQRFPEHWGFDVEAIETAYALNQYSHKVMRRQHHQPASGQEPLPLVGTQLFSQGARGLLHRPDREPVAETADTGGLFERRRVRLRHLRRRSVRAALLPQTPPPGLRAPMSPCSPPYCRTQSGFWRQRRRVQAVSGSGANGS